MVSSLLSTSVSWLNCMLTNVSVSSHLSVTAHAMFVCCYYLRRCTYNKEIYMTLHFLPLNCVSLPQSTAARWISICASPLLPVAVVAPHETNICRCVFAIGHRYAVLSRVPYLDGTLAVVMTALSKLLWVCASPSVDCGQSYDGHTSVDGHPVVNDCSRGVAVSYTHLTLPTKRIV